MLYVNLQEFKIFMVTIIMNSFKYVKSEHVPSSQRGSKINKLGSTLKWMPPN